jgi:hypothetical protein
MALFKSIGAMANTPGTMFPGTIVPIIISWSGAIVTRKVVRSRLQVVFPMPDYVQLQSRDYWVKDAHPWLHWVLMEPVDYGTVLAYFLEDGSEVFGDLAFPSAEVALDALRRNGFRRYLEDNSLQSSPYHIPPSPPFRRRSDFDRLYSIFWTDIPVSEADVLQKLAAIIKKHEPQFELDGAFVTGVRGRADPQYSVARAERLRRLPLEDGNAFLAEDLDDYHFQADPRINWRVTFPHGDYYIHIMAIDQGLSRFACCLQTESDFEDSLRSAGGSLYTHYETGNLAEIERVLVDIYARFNREVERTAEQERSDKVEEERKLLQERLASVETKRHTLICISICIITVSLILYTLSKEWVSFDRAFSLIFATIILIVGWHQFREAERRREIERRADDERLHRKWEREEQYRIYEEGYRREGKALSQRVLDGLQAIARGEKSRLDAEATEAARGLQARQGEHPETVAAWALLMNDLSAEIIDPWLIRGRLNELLYPETLEDVDELKTLVQTELKTLVRGDNVSPNPAAADAAKALNNIKERDARRKRDEMEAEQLTDLADLFNNFSSPKTEEEKLRRRAEIAAKSKTL